MLNRRRMPTFLSQCACTDTIKQHHGRAHLLRLWGTPAISVGRQTEKSMKQLPYMHNYCTCCLPVSLFECHHPHPLLNSEFNRIFCCILKASIFLGFHTLLSPWEILSWTLKDLLKSRLMHLQSSVHSTQWLPSPLLILTALSIINSNGPHL